MLITQRQRDRQWRLMDPSAKNGVLSRYIFIGVAIALIALASCFPAHGLEGISPITAGKVIATILKHEKSVPDEEIVRLSTIAKQPGGTKIVGREQRSLNLPNDVLEDTYIRIAINQSTLSRQEAEGMLSHLGGTPGFRTTLRKTVGASGIKTSGHLNELRLADTARKYRFNVLGIGVPFNDGRKQGVTDIDVLLQIGKRQIAIEAKDYLPGTPIPMDKFRADLISLEQYSAQIAPTKVITVFTITNKPNDPIALKILEKEASRHGVQLVIGSPEQQIIQIQQLEKIL